MQTDQIENCGKSGFWQQFGMLDCHLSSSQPERRRFRLSTQFIIWKIHKLCRCDALVQLNLVASLSHYITYYEIVQHNLHSLNSWQYLARFSHHTASNDSTLQSLWWLSVIVSEMKPVGSWVWAQMRLKQQQLTTYHRILFIKVKDTVELHSFVQQRTSSDGGKCRWIHIICWTETPSSLPSISCCLATPSRSGKKESTQVFFFVFSPPLPLHLSYLNSIKKN